MKCQCVMGVGYTAWQANTVRRWLNAQASIVPLVKRARSSRVRGASDASIHVGDGCCVGLWFTRLWGVWPGRIFIHHQSQFSRFQQIINFLLPTREVSICVTAVLSTASVAVHVGIPFIQANDDHRQPLAVIPSWPRERRW